MSTNCPSHRICKYEFFVVCVFISVFCHSPHKQTIGFLPGFTAFGSQFRLLHLHYLYLLLLQHTRSACLWTYTKRAIAHTHNWDRCDWKSPYTICICISYNPEWWYENDCKIDVEQKIHLAMALYDDNDNGNDNDDQISDDTVLFRFFLFFNLILSELCTACMVSPCVRISMHRFAQYQLQSPLAMHNRKYILFLAQAIFFIV